MIYRSYVGLLAILVGLVLLTFIASLAVGPSGIGLCELGSAVRDGSGTDAASLILWELRLPRALLGALIGASLALAGACLQGYLRNPLAEPGVIGISSASALGAVTAIYTGLAMRYPIALPLLAIGGSVIAVLALQILAHTGNALTLILAGVALGELGPRLAVQLRNRRRAKLHHRIVRGEA